MKNKILLSLLNSNTPLSMSEISDKTKIDIQLCNYHLKKMLNEKVIVCINKDKKLYDVHQIVRDSKLYDALFGAMTISVPEFYEELKDNKIVVECIKQVLLQVLNDIEKD